MQALKLAQTLAGSWVITLENPEERGWETQLAEFNTDNTADGSIARGMLEAAAAEMFAKLREQFKDFTVGVVQSHDPAERARMNALVEAVAAQEAA